MRTIAFILLFAVSAWAGPLENQTAAVATKRNAVGYTVYQDHGLVQEDGSYMLGQDTDYNDYVMLRFTSGDAADITRIRVKFGKTGTPAQSVTAQIHVYATHAQVGTGTATLTAANISTGSNYFVLSAAVSLSATTEYYVRLQASASDNSNHYLYYYDDAAGTGIKESADGSTWATKNSDADGNFTLYTGGS